MASLPDWVIIAWGLGVLVQKFNCVGNMDF